MKNVHPAIRRGRQSSPGLASGLFLNRSTRPRRRALPPLRSAHKPHTQHILPRLRERLLSALLQPARKFITRRRRAARKIKRSRLDSHRPAALPKFPRQHSFPRLKQLRKRPVHLLRPQRNRRHLPRKRQVARPPLPILAQPFQPFFRHFGIHIRSVPTPRNAGPAEVLLFSVDRRISGPFRRSPARSFEIVQCSRRRLWKRRSATGSTIKARDCSTKSQRGK